ncbi:MAG: FmdE family protein [Thermaerobacter sp.]|nr:FmdE family protein [Thermaerobacter sp.]
MKDLEEFLEEAHRRYGHRCAGQILGIRMSLAGLRDLGLDPRESRERLVTFVEIDRCATDAIELVTGCRLGRRTLKFRDYGIMAATFVDLEEHRAVRVLTRDDARESALAYFPDAPDPTTAQRQAYRTMPEAQLFTIEPVSVELGPWDLPGPTRRKVVCAACAQVVRDGKEVWVEGRPLCKPCAGGAYFQRLP